MKIINVFESFLKPFDAVADELMCVMSSTSVPPNIAKDIENAEKVGKSAKDVFITDILKSNKDFFAPLTKQKLKTFAYISKKALVKTSSKTTIKYK